MKANIQQMLPDIFEDQLNDFCTRQRVVALYTDCDLMKEIEIGSINGLCKIHRYLFEGISSNPGVVRTIEVSNGIHRYIKAAYLPSVFPIINTMPENTFEEIVDKYMEMMLLHPFTDGNGRSIRIWFDYILMRTLSQRIDWGAISYSQCLWAQRKSTMLNSIVVQLFSQHLIPIESKPSPFFKIHDRVIHYDGPVQLRLENKESDNATLHLTIPCQSNLLPLQEGLDFQGEAFFEGRIN